jgi:hypothetical protein
MAAQHTDDNAPSSSTPAPAGKNPKRKKGRLLKVLVGVVVVGVVLLIGLVLALPAIVSSIAPSRIASAVNDTIAGSIEVDKISVSLFSGQAVGDIRLYDTDQTLIGTVRASADATLWGLITGNMNLGEIRIAGALDVDRNAQGELNLLRAVGPSTPAPADAPASPSGTPSGSTTPLVLPSDLSSTLVIEDLDITYTDAALADATGDQVATFALRDFAGRVDLAIGQPINGTLAGKLLSGPARTTLSEDGDIVLTLDLRDWSAADGTITPDRIAGSGSLKAQTLDASVDAALTFQNGVITTQTPATAAINLDPWSKRLVAVGQTLSESPGLVIDQFPQVNLQLDQLRVELPKAGQSLDLRTVLATVALTVGPLVGSADPGAMGLEGTQRQAFTTKTTNATLTLGENQTAQLTASGAAMVGDQSAGTLDAQFNVARYFDAAGAPTMPRELAGQAELRGVATAILDPFLAAILSSEGEPMLRLTEDLGPTLDLRLAANSGTPTTPPEVASATDGPVVPIHITGQLQAAKAQGVLDLTLDGDVITSPPTSGLKVTLSEPAGLLARFLPMAEISRAGPVELTVSRVRADTGALMAGENPDLRAAGMLVSLTSGAIAGTIISTPPVPVQPEGQTNAAPAPQPVRTPFAAGPLQARVDATALREGRVTLALSTGGSYAGESAGTVNVQGNASGLLNEAGWINLNSVPMVNAEARLEGLSTRMLTALAGEALGGIDPVRDIGPTADAVLTITNPSAEELHADLSVTSQFAQILAPISLTSERIASRGMITVTHTSPTGLINALTQVNPPLTPLPGQAPMLRAQIADLLVPLGEQAAPQMQQAAAKATLSLGGLASGALSLASFTTQAELLPNAGATLKSDLAMAHNNTPFTGVIDARVAKLFDDAGAPLQPLAMQPTGKLELRNAPPAIAQLLPATTRYIGEGQTRLDLAELIGDLTGGPFSVTADLGAAGNAQSIKTAFNSPRTTFNADASLAGSTLSVPNVTLNTQITGPALARVLTMTGQAPGAQPTLTEPSKISVKVQPFEIPLTPEYAPNFAAANGNLNISGTIEASVTNLSPGAAPELNGPFRLQEAGFSLAGPLATLAGAKPGTAAIRAGGFVATPQNQRGRFELSADPRISEGALAGAFPLTVTLNDLPVAFVDGIMGQPGLVAGAVGPTLGLDLNASMEAGGSSPLKSVSLGIRSQRVNTTKPLTIAADGTTLRLTAPAELTAVLDPAWANKYLLGDGAGPDAPPPLMLLTGPTNATLRLNQLVLPAQMGGTPQAPGGPMKLGVFKIDAAIDLPQTSLAVGETRAPVGINGGTLTLKPTNIPNATLDYDLRVRQWTAGGAQSDPQQASRVWGTLFGLASPSGQINAQNANMTGAFELPGVPTALIDAFARTDLPSKTLGSTVSAKGWYREISSIAGAYHFEAVSPNANAMASGYFQDGYLMITQPEGGRPTATITRVTPELTADLAKALPLLRSLEKTDQDEPLQLILTTNVAVPIDGNMNNLGGYFTLDMGTARFALKNEFLGRLKVPNTRETGEVGRRLNPLHVVMDRGVVAYQPWKLPVGEFEFILVGAVNLSDRAWESPGLNLKAGPGGTMDVITYIPAGAVAAEAISALRLPGALGPQVMVPFRSRGPLDNPKLEVDLGLMAKETLRPENILQGAGDVLGKPGDVLKELLGGGGRR